MTQQSLSFLFQHRLYQYNGSLLSLSSVCAERIVEDAFKTFLADESYTDPDKWIKEQYDAWLKSYVYVSDHMPDKCKQILKSK
jgi:hypothetical protein